MSFWKKQLTESTNMLLKYASRVIFNDSPNNFFLLTLMIDPGSGSALIYKAGST